MVIEKGSVAQLQGADGRTSLRIGSSKDHSGDSGMYQSRHAHGTGFKGDEEGAIRHAVIAEGEACVAKGNDFCVGGGIMGGDGAIPSSGNHFFLQDHDGSYRDFAFRLCLPRALDRFPHPVIIWSMFSHRRL